MAPILRPQPTQGRALLEELQARDAAVPGKIHAQLMDWWEKFGKWMKVMMNMYKKCMDILIVSINSNTHDSGTFSFQCINSGICSIGDIGDRKITENGIGTTTHGSNMFQPMEKPTRVSHPRAVTGGPWLISHLHCWGKAPKDRSAVNCA